MIRSLLVFCAIFGFMRLQAQNGYAVDLTLKPYKQEKVYLGYYYGEKKAIADSAILDANSRGVFKGVKPLPGGIYFIVSPRKEILFELLIDKQQRFSIQADTTRLPDGVVFTNSTDNLHFQQYTSFANGLSKIAAKANQDMAKARTAKDSAAAESILKGLGLRLKQYRDSINKKAPQTIMAALFRAMDEPEVPPAGKHPGGKYDSNYAYRYFKSHFWDGVSFDDERLIRTPFFEPKLNRYYRDLVPPSPDSIIREVDRMILYARPSNEMYKFMMVHFVQKYINPEYMGQDAVFVHLFEKYINSGQTDFFTEQYKDFMTRRAYSMMANLIGRPAADLDMVDSLDKPRNLFSVQSDLTVVCFWDPTCSHCKEVVPKLDSVFKTKWKNQGVSIYGVMTDGGKPNWIQFIKDHRMNDWIHVYELPSTAAKISAENKPSYKQLYDVYQTPLLYLLDKDKRIIAKKLSLEQLDEVIQLKLKNTPAR